MLTTLYTLQLSFPPSSLYSYLCPYIPHSLPLSLPLSLYSYLCPYIPTSVPISLPLSLYPYLCPYILTFVPISLPLSLYPYRCPYILTFVPISLPLSLYPYLCPTLDKVMVFSLFSVFVPLDWKSPNFFGDGDPSTSLDLEKISILNKKLTIKVYVFSKIICYALFFRYT